MMWVFFLGNAVLGLYLWWTRWHNAPAAPQAESNEENAAQPEASVQLV